MTCFVWVSSVLGQGIGIAFWIHSDASEVFVHVPEKLGGLWKTKGDDGKSDLLHPHLGRTTQVQETQTGNPA